MKAPTISDEYRQALHRALDKAIDDLGGHCDVSVDYGTTQYPDETTGSMRMRHTGTVTIAITPSSE
jgi:hypothetical protein